MGSALKSANAALLLSAVLMAVLGSAFYAGFLWPAAAQILAMLAIVIQLGAPLVFLERHHINPKQYNIYGHKLEFIIDNILSPGRRPKSWPDWPAVLRESKVLLALCAAILLPYSAVYLGYFLINSQATFSLTLPANLTLGLITQVFVVALPEEVFFRGFLQSALLERWPNKFFVGPLPLGRAIILTNAIFALCHVVNGFMPIKLLTFFPGLIFSYLVYKNRSLYSAVLFHAICNIMAQILYLSVIL